MSKLDDIRKQYPGAYDDMSDAELANALYSKSYSDMDRAEFDTLIGTGIQEGDWGPRGLGDNFARAGQSLNDSMRIIADSATRGYGDKALGPEEQALTEAARQRQGWGGTALDVGTSVATLPIRIGSMAGGALAGGLEGAASAYGHQDGWVPDAGEAVDILKGAGTGAAFGAGGAKLGEWIGDWWGGRQAEAARPYKTDAELRAASVADPSNLDLGARLARVNMIRGTQGTTRDTFAHMLSGMQEASPEVQAKIAEIAGQKGLVSAAGGMLPDALTAGGLDRTLAVGLTLGPKAAAARLGAQGLKAAGESDWAKQVPPKAIDELATLERSGPLNIDPATIDKWRDLVAKAGIGYGRSP